MPRLFYAENDFLEWLTKNCDKCKKEDSCQFRDILWEAHDRGDYQVDPTTAAAVGYFCKWSKGRNWSCCLFSPQDPGDSRDCPVSRLINKEEKCFI